MFGLAVHHFVKVKKCFWCFGDRNSASQTIFPKRNHKKNSFKPTNKVQSRDWSPGAVQGKSIQISYHTELSDSSCVVVLAPRAVGRGEGGADIYERLRSHRTASAYVASFLSLWAFRRIFISVSWM